jgi:O-antigen ligase
VTLVVLCCRRYVNPWIVGCLSYGLLVLSAMSLALGFALPASVQKFLSEEVPFMAFLLRGQAMEEFLSLSGRTEFWQHVHALFLKHPLLGYGYLASRSMLLQGLPRAGEAYNALAASLLDVGVIGTALVWFALMRAFLSSLLGTLRISGTGGWQHVSVFGALLFLVLHSLVDATFAGTPGYQVLLLFATVLAHNRLTQELWSGVGRMAAGAWRWSSAPPRLREALLVWACLKRAVAPAQKTS